MVKADLQHISWRRKYVLAPLHKELEQKLFCFSSMTKKTSLQGSVEVSENRLKPAFLNWRIILWDVFSSSKN